MWISVRLDDFAVTCRGAEFRASGAGHLYQSPGLNISSVDALRHAEYGQAVYVEAASHTVEFGRDYLGHHPLLYALTQDFLYISDNIGEIRRALKQAGVKPVVSEEAVALYLTMGYVPQGMTLYKQIVACENATIYRLKNMRISTRRIFEPVEIRPNVADADLEEAIRESIRVATQQTEVDVWCSGGLDSSAMAWECSQAIQNTELLTLSYGASIETIYGEGEAPFARHMADACGVRLREANLNDEAYHRIYASFLDNHIGPVVDTCALAKYALAEHSRGTVVTGEGGDPLFGGVKNNLVVYALNRNPALDIGEVYAQAHQRFFSDLGRLMRRGTELKEFASGYMRTLLDRYPGDLLRKMFYVNTFEKQGGMIFPQSYCPAQVYGTRIRHPLTSLSVYDVAFSMRDSLRYVYPSGKLALMRIYNERLPKQIASRKKSGTLMPLRHYLTNLPENYYDLSALYQLEIMEQDYVHSEVTFDSIVNKHTLLHAIFTINAYIQRGETDDEFISAEGCCDHEPRACVVV